MRKVSIIHNVVQILKHQKSILFSTGIPENGKMLNQGNKILMFKGNENRELMKVPVYRMANFNEGFIFNESTAGGALNIVLNEKHIRKEDADYLFSDYDKIDNRQVITKRVLVSGKYTYGKYLLDRELKQISFNAKYFDNVFGTFYRRINKNLLLRIGNENEEIWQTDLSRIGDYIKLDGSRASSNEIDGELFGSETLGLVYVPMAGGQLVALDINTGNVVWVCSTKGNGRYAIFEDKIYKESDNLYVIDAASGIIIMQKDFEQIIPEYFVPSGPVWVNPDVLILLSVREAKVALINKETLELEDLVHIPNVPGIPHSKDVIVWNDNKLYVLDMERTLHIFEKE